MTFSVLRGLKDEARYQNAIKIGTVVNRPKKMLVFNPPPTFHEKYVGTPAMRAKRRILEKLSFPGPSAGRGPFLIAGYCAEISACSQLTSAGGQIACCGWLTTYRSSSHTTLFKFLEGRSGSFGGLDELELALRAIDALGLGRHDCGPPNWMYGSSREGKW